MKHLSILIIHLQQYLPTNFINFINFISNYLQISNSVFYNFLTILYTLFSMKFPHTVMTLLFSGRRIKHIRLFQIEAIEV